MVTTDRGSRHFAPEQPEEKEEEIEEERKSSLQRRLRMNSLTCVFGGTLVSAKLPPPLHNDVS